MPGLDVLLLADQMGGGGLYAGEQRQETEDHTDEHLEPSSTQIVRILFLQNPSKNTARPHAQRAIPPPETGH